jgi:hypothetical protein
MSPEQAMGRELDGRSDIYTLGVLFWELLEDKRPFEGTTPMEVMLKHINEPVPGVPEPVQGPMRGHLKPFFEWVMEKKPQNRPQTCQELKIELLKIAALCPEGGMPAEAHHTTTMDTDSLRAEPSGTLNTGLAHTPAAAFSTSRFASKKRLLLAAAVCTGLGVATAMFVGEAAVEPTHSSRPTPSDSDAGQAGVPEPAPVAEADRPADAAPAPKPEAAPEPKEIVTIAIGSEPQGAHVVDVDGAVLGNTPIEIQRAVSAGSVNLTLKMSGYEDRKLLVDPNKSLMWAVALAKVAPDLAPEAVKPSKPRRAKAKGRRNTKSKPAGSSPAPTGKSGFGTF